MRNWIYLTGIIALSFISGCSVGGSVEWGTTGRPGGSHPLEVAIAPDSIYLFRDADFHGDVTRVEGVTHQPAGALQSLEARRDNLSSVRWDLPPGVVVVLYDNADGTSEQLPIWGRGQIRSVAAWRFDNRASRWAWYYIGAERAAVNDDIARGYSQRPPTSKPLGATASAAVRLPSGVVEAYEDVGLRGTMRTLGPVTALEQGVRHGMGVMNDRMSSLRWDLPPVPLLPRAAPSSAPQPRQNLYRSWLSRPQLLQVAIR